LTIISVFALILGAAGLELMGLALGGLKDVLGLAIGCCETLKQNWNLTLLSLRYNLVSAINL